MTKQGTILIVDDNKGVLAAIDMLLSGTFKKVITISNPNRIPAMLETENIDVVLLDMNFSSGINNGNEGIFWLGEIRKISNDLPVVLFTAYADIELAVKTVKEGATDFVVKPWDNAKLIATLLSAYRLRQSQTEVKQLRENEESIRAVCIFPDEEFLPYSSDYNTLYNIRSQDIYFAVRYQSQPPNTIPLHRPPDKSGLYFDEIGLPIVPDEYKHSTPVQKSMR